MNNLFYVPKQQFESVLESSCSLEVKTEIFSNYLINKFRNRNTCMTNRIVKNAINY